MNSIEFSGTLQDSSPTTIVTCIGNDAAIPAEEDDVIDWTTDCIGDGHDVLEMTSCATGYGGSDYDDINGDVQAMLESIDFLDAFAAEFDSRCGNNAEAQYGTEIAFDINNHTSISIGQPTCEIRDRMNVETSSLEKTHTNVNVFQHATPLKKRGISSGKGPSHRTAKKKSKGLPKRPLSKYNLFFQSERLKILAEATQNHTRISFENLAKIIGKRWHDLSEEDSEKFRILSELDIARYRQEMKAYHAKRRTSTCDTASSSGIMVDDNDDKTVSSTSVKRRQSICSPKSPSTPRRKRKYSESSVSTAASFDSTQLSQPTAKSKVSTYSTCNRHNDSSSAKNDEMILIRSPEQRETLSSNEDRVPDDTECACQQENDSRRDEVYSGKGDEERNFFKADQNLPLIRDDEDEVESAVAPPRYPQRDHVAKEEQLSSAQESNERLPPQTPSQNHLLQREYQDAYHDEGNPNSFVIPPSKEFEPRTNPIGDAPTNVTQAHYPYPPPGAPQPYFYGNALPPPFHYIPHHHSYSRQNRNMYHAISLPLDHNKEVMIYDPQIKRDRRYTIQYKCYSMKRSVADAYLSRVSSAMATPTLPSASSNVTRMSNFNRNCIGKYNVSMQMLLQHPIPGVEVDLWNHSVSGPINSLPSARVHGAPPPIPPVHYQRQLQPPPPMSLQFSNARR